MKLRKKLSQRNLDGMFRLILLVYGKIMKKVSVKIYTEQFKKFHECKFEKKMISARVSKTWNHKLRLIWNSSCYLKETPP